MYKHDYDDLTHPNLSVGVDVIGWEETLFPSHASLHTSTWILQSCFTTRADYCSSIV